MPLHIPPLLKLVVKSDRKSYPELSLGATEMFKSLPLQGVVSQGKPGRDNVPEISPSPILHNGPLQPELEGSGGHWCLSRAATSQQNDTHSLETSRGERNKSRDTLNTFHRRVFLPPPHLPSVTNHSGVDLQSFC